jgi:hypothetical protein
MYVSSLILLASIVSGRTISPRSLTCGLALNKYPCSYLPDENATYCCDQDPYDPDNRILYCDFTTNTIVQGSCGANQVCSDNPDGTANCG